MTACLPVVYWCVLRVSLCLYLLRFWRAKFGVTVGLYFPTSKFRVFTDQVGTAVCLEGIICCMPE